MRRNFPLSRLINLWWPYGLKRTLAHNKIWDCSNQMLEDQLLTAKQHNFELFDAVYVTNSLLEVCSCWCVDGHQTLCLESLCKRHFTLFFLSISLPPSFFLSFLLFLYCSWWFTAFLAVAPEMRLTGRDLLSHGKSCEAIMNSEGLILCCP